MNIETNFLQPIFENSFKNIDILVLSNSFGQKLYLKKFKDYQIFTAKVLKGMSF
jgi:hypothetical protein